MMLERIYNIAGKVWEGICTKSGEKIADVAIGTGGRVLGFETGLKRLEENSKMLSNIESDVLTVVESEELSGRKKRKRAVKEWMDGSAQIQRDVHLLQDKARQDKLKGHITCVNQVKNLNKRVKKQIERRRDFGDELLLDNHECRGEKLLLPEMYGEIFWQNLREIFDCIDTGIEQIITICGDDGAGKTTLVKHVHNKVLEETDDNRVYWVRVSENMSVKKLQDDISRAIHINLENETDEDKRGARLYQALKKKAKFVLILVNLRDAVNLRKVGFPIGVVGCRLVITTCSSRVCKLIGSDKTFEVKMDEAKAWDIFKEAYGQDVSFNLQQEDVKLAVTNPDRIVELAKSMRREGVQPGSREWRYRLEEVDD